MKKIVKILQKIIKESIKILVILLFFSAIFLSIGLKLGTNWAKENYNYSSFDEILYTLGTSVTTASRDVLIDFFINIIVPSLKTTLIIFGCFILIYVLYKIFVRKTNIQLRLILFGKKIVLHFNIIIVFLLILSVIPIYKLSDSIQYAMKELYIDEYLEANLHSSTFFEEEYVNPENVKLEFPKKKRNLIYIYLESMEATYADYDNGGGYPYNYIPNLTELALDDDNISFSNTDNLGGAHMTSGTTWTMGGIVAETAGVPIKNIFGPNSEESYAHGLVNGAYALGDILEKEGYNQSIMVGSDLSFGGRREYFKTHGKYKNYDLYTAREDEIIDDDYYVFWGYEDEKLFEYAKEELTNIASKDEPFNFTMLTVDTHAPNGYESDFCPNYSSKPYLNAIYCSDMQLGEFIEWIQEQDFYDNTTVILTGDHLSMANYPFEDVEDSYERRVYNLFLHSAVETDKTKNREFTTFDYYPTTLAALGVKIKGDKLGLGTNLFSDKKTLSERYGNDYIDKELSQRSTYYDACINLGKCD